MWVLTLILLLLVWFKRSGNQTMFLHERRCRKCARKLVCMVPRPLGGLVYFPIGQWLCMVLVH